MATKERTVDTALVDALAHYADLIRAWAPRLDLVSDADLPHLEERHLDDSLRLLPLVEGAPAGAAADAGSGAGLPGIPLALATRGRRLWRLIEPRKKRAAFLEEVIRQLGLDAEVVPTTAEEAVGTGGLAASHAVATARALAPPHEALERIRPLVVSGGLAVVIQGEDLPAPQGARLWEPGVAVLRVD